ncbi:MAG: hypothetical protein F4139_07235 [Gemmatimonadetes bacterium]|nr:hypothetical protein [Gemmatimonadota bacterium]MYK67092.1 hypothetical protein [Gemmatimonadota bacterium]
MRARAARWCERTNSMFERSDPRPSKPGRGTRVIPVILAAGALWLPACMDDSGSIEPQNRPPVLSQALPDVSVNAGTSDTVDVWEYFIDPDGDALSFTAESSNTGVATVAVYGSSVVVHGVAQGRVTITVTATDDEGLAASANFEAEVKGFDWNILVELYESTGGSMWRYQFNWLTDEPLDTWYGVRVDLGARVVALSLANNRLQGSLPPSLGELAGLYWLSLPGNELSGPIPSALFGLSGLSNLDLADNEFVGTISEQIADLSNLNSLNLSANRLTGRIPPELGEMTELSGLGLWDNELSGPIPAALANLSGLTTLYLGGNRLSGPIPPELGSLAGLLWLSLRDNRLSGPIPAALAEARQLRELDLSGNELTGSIPAEFGELRGLSLLALSGNTLSGPIPGELGAMRYLNVLDLSDNQLEGSIPAELAALWDLAVLQLSGNSLAGAIPPALGDLRNLEELYLGDNDLTGPLPPELGNLRRLELLDLRGNMRLSGEIPAAWAGLGRLETLATHDTGLCAPADPVVQDWLEGVTNQRLASCGSWDAYLVQTVQSREYPVPLVAGSDALLRVFPTALRTTEAGLPPVRATFYLDGVESHQVEIPGKSTPVPTAIDESSLDKSANADVPGSVVQPGLEMVIEIDPGGTLDPSLGVTRRIPENGRLPVRVVDISNLDFTLIPFLWSEEPDSAILGLVEEMAENPESHQMFALMRTLLPVPEITASKREPVWTSTNVASELYAEIAAIRVMEQGSRSAGLSRYVGMMSGAVEGGRETVWGDGRLAFVIPDDTVFAQTIGVLTGLPFARCGEAHPDPFYPYEDGSIGAWGYDIRVGELVPPATPDLMSQCGFPRWISDYHYAKAVRFRRGGAGAREAGSGAATRSLLLWGGMDARGTPYLEPAFVADVPRPSLPRGSGHEITGRTASGEALFSLRFGMAEAVDGGGGSFAFAIPVEPDWAEKLAVVTLSGPGGNATLDMDTDRPMVILRNPRTGRVRGILRGSPVETPGDAGGRGLRFPLRGLEVLTSRGIPDAAAWRRQ